jgi:hypothetical protein
VLPKSFVDISTRKLHPKACALLRNTSQEGLVIVNFVCEKRSILLVEVRRNRDEA